MSPLSAFDLSPGLPQGLGAWMSTRAGGHSTAPWDSFNLGDHVGDVPEAVQANRQLLAHTLGVRPVFLKQVHGQDVIELMPDTPDGAVADACFTFAPGLACTIMVADCLPVLLTHPDGGVVAAAHAGWRGLAGGVIEQTVSAMCQAKGLKAQHLSVWLGPCIGPTAFEVGDEVRQTFMQADANMQRYFKAHPTHSNKWLADLAGMARARLAALGIQDIHGNDSTPAWCTVGQSSRFFSYRRDGVTGRFAACIWRHS